MRIIHTADWHIGQTLNGFGRETEHAALFERLPEIVREHDADALVVAGDVFDGVNPSAEATKMLYDALAELHKAKPSLQIVLTAGNHDPAWRLEAPVSLFAGIGVRVAGVIHRRADKTLDTDRHVIPLRDASGKVRANVLAIPYLRAGDLPIRPEDSESEGSVYVKATRRLYAEAVQAARAVGDGLPLMVTGHLHCVGAQESEGSERRVLIGGEHAAPLDVFPADVEYVALGHLHRAQNIGRETVRYSGSPFPLSASEIPYEHGVTLVEFGAQGTATEHIKLPRRVQCLRLPKTGSLTIAELPAAVAALEIDPDTPDDVRPFVHVVVRPEGPAAGLSSEVQRILEDKPVRCAAVKLEKPPAPEGQAAPEPAKSLEECDPADLFDRAFSTVYGRAPSEKQRALFESIREGE